MRNDTTNPDEVRELHPSVAHVLQFFAYGHLPAELQNVSEKFANLAHLMAHSFDPGPELTVALRKLLEAKDAAVRHALIDLRK